METLVFLPMDFEPGKSDCSCSIKLFFVLVKCGMHWLLSKWLQISRTFFLSTEKKCKTAGSLYMNVVALTIKSEFLIKMSQGEGEGGNKLWEQNDK